MCIRDRLKGDAVFVVVAYQHDVHGVHQQVGQQQEMCIRDRILAVVGFTGNMEVITPAVRYGIYTFSLYIPLAMLDVYKRQYFYSKLT